ncbi:GIY-YIG nuclease family protein, partial [Flavobacterium psychrophilum]
ENEEVLYIGSSIHLVARIESQHFLSKHGNLSEDCILETQKVLYHQGVSDSDMKIKERYLINTLNPKYNNKMNQNDKFSFEIPNINWKLYSLDTIGLIEKREIKTGAKFNLINHNLNIERSDQTWITHTVYLKEINKSTFFRIHNTEFIDYRHNPRFEKTIRSFILINNELYINDYVNLQYHYANYRELSKQYNLKKGEDFLTVCEHKDLENENLDLEDEVALIGLSIVKYEIVKKYKFYTDAQIDFCEKKLRKMNIVN